MSMYQSNLEALFQAYPNVATRIGHYQQNERYEIFMDAVPESLNLIDTQTFSPLYSESPQQTVHAQALSFDMYREYPYLYFFGLGNGALLKHLLSNPNHKRIVVIEPDPEIAYIVLNMFDFAADILSERLVILLSEIVDFPLIADFFKDMDVQRYARVYDLHPMSSFYEDHYAQQLHEVNHLILETLHHMIKTAGNDTTDSLIGMKHHFTNLPYMLDTPTFIELVRKAKTTDIAILVSAGPSLSKQLPLLKKAAPYVTIFAVDAVFPILIKNGIKPDVVFSVERVEATANFFKQTPSEAYKDVIIALSSLQHSEVINSIKGGTVQMSMRPFGYMKATGHNAWGYVGIGMSSANMAYETIYHAGFTTCVLIGQDLAYGKDGSSHSSGHIFGTNEVKHNPGDIWIEGYGGTERVRTNEVWTLFRKFFEKDVDAAKQKMQTINATEGGARIYGTIEMPFNEVISSLVKKHHAKKKIVLSLPDKTKLEAAKKQVWENVTIIQNYAQARKEEIIALFLNVATLCDSLETATIQETEIDILLTHIGTIRSYIEEPMYDGVIWDIAKSMLMVQELDLAMIEVRPVNTPEERYQKKTDLLKAYKTWLFLLAGCIDTIVKTIAYAHARQLINVVDLVDVIVNDRKIDTVDIHSMHAEAGEIFDVDMRGFLYELPSEYTGQKTIFVHQSDKNTLPEEFISTIDESDDYYNELHFIDSLKGKMDSTVSEYVCTNQRIGFLGINENLDHNAFINHLKLLLDQIDELELYIFCFNNQQEQKIKQLAFEKEQKVKILIIKNVEEISKNVSLCLFTHTTPLEDRTLNYLKENTQTATMLMNFATKTMTLKHAISLHQENGHPVLQSPEYFGFTEKELEASSFSVHKVLYEKYLGNIDLNENFYNLLYVRLITGILQNTDLRAAYIQYIHAEHQYFSRT